MSLIAYPCLCASVSVFLYLRVSVSLCLCVSVSVCLCVSVRLCVFLAQARGIAVAGGTCPTRYCSGPGQWVGEP